MCDFFKKKIVIPAFRRPKKNSKFFVKIEKKNSCKNGFPALFYGLKTCVICQKNSPFPPGFFLPGSAFWPKIGKAVPGHPGTTPHGGRLTFR
jgi:hypothetical protein